MTKEEIIKGNQVLHEYIDGHKLFSATYHTSYDAMRPVWDKWIEDDYPPKESLQRSIIRNRIEKAWSYGTPLELFTALVAAVEWLNGVKQLKG